MLNLSELSCQRTPILSLILLLSLGLTACQSESKPTDPRATAEKRAATDPSEVNAEKGWGSDLTAAQKTSLDIGTGLRNGDAGSVAIAQRMLLLPLFNNSLNLFYSEHAELPPTLGQLIPAVTTWPLTQAGTPWPIVQNPSESAYPRMWIDSQSSLKPFDLVIEATDFDDVAMRPFRDFFTREWEQETGSNLATQDFGGADPNFGLCAANLCLVVSTYRAHLGSYPPSPADAFATFHMGLQQPTIAALEKTYPQREFWRSKDGTSFGLLLGGSKTEPRLFVRHESKDGKFTTVMPYGYPGGPSVQLEIDKWLAEMEPWADWSSIASVPRIPMPNLPVDVQPTKSSTGTAEAPDVAKSAH